MLLISSLTCGRSLGRVSLGFFHGLQQARGYKKEQVETERAMSTRDPVNLNVSNKEGS